MEIKTGAREVRREWDSLGQWIEDATDKKSSKSHLPLSVVARFVLGTFQHSTSWPNVRYPVLSLLFPYNSSY